MKTKTSIIHLLITILCILSARAQTSENLSATMWTLQSIRDSQPLYYFALKPDHTVGFARNFDGQLGKIAYLNASAWKQSGAELRITIPEDGGFARKGTIILKLTDGILLGEWRFEDGTKAVPLEARRVQTLPPFGGPLQASQEMMTGPAGGAHLKPNAKTWNGELK